MMHAFDRAGVRFVEVGVSHHARPYGRSQFFRLPAIARSAKQLMALWWRVMIRRRPDVPDETHVSRLNQQ